MSRHRSQAASRQAARYLAALALVAAVTACNDDGLGAAEPPPTTDLPTQSSPPNDQQAPRVAVPLDAEAFAPDPCRSLTAVQQKDFGFDEGEKDNFDALSSTRCIYRDRNTQISASVSYFPEQTAGLTHMYLKHSAGEYDVWEPMEIDGYPAVRHGTAEEEAQGSCGIAVGVTDSLFFATTIIGEPGADNCTAAKNVAKAVLATIKAGG